MDEELTESDETLCGCIHDNWGWDGRHDCVDEAGRRWQWMVGGEGGSCPTFVALTVSITSSVPRSAPSYRVSARQYYGTAATDQP
jgi:hypothetical protein